MEALLLLEALGAAVLLCLCSRVAVRGGRPGRGRHRRACWCALVLRRIRTIALCGAKLKRGGAELREPALVIPRVSLAPFQEDSRHGAGAAYFPLGKRENIDPSWCWGLARPLPPRFCYTIERISATTHPASYRTPAQGPLGVRLGRIVG
jgi:hypothetical protein